MDQNQIDDLLRQQEQDQIEVALYKYARSLDFDPAHAAILAWRCAVDFNALCEELEELPPSEIRARIAAMAKGNAPA